MEGEKGGRGGEGGGDGRWGFLNSTYNLCKVVCTTVQREKETTNITICRTLPMNNNNNNNKNMLHASCILGNMMHK